MTIAPSLDSVKVEALSNRSELLRNSYRVDWAHLYSNSLSENWVFMCIQNYIYLVYLRLPHISARQFLSTVFLLQRKQYSSCTVQVNLSTWISVQLSASDIFTWLMHAPSVCKILKMHGGDSTVVPCTESCFRGS